MARLFPLGLAAVLFLAVPTAAEAQDFRLDEGPRNTVFLELGGNAFLYSFNLERRVERWWLRIGGGWAEDTKGDTQGEVWGVPVMVGTLFGTGPHYFEVGAGVALAKHVDDETAFLYGTGTIGYRYLNPTSGLMIRAGVAPYFDPTFDEDPGVWPAVSIGWAW